MTIARFSVLAGVTAGLLAARPAAAGEVVIFDGPVPSAAQLAGILWPDEPKGEGGGGLSRSIRIEAPPGDASAGPPGAGARAETAAPGKAFEVASTAPGEPAGFGFLIRFAFDSASVRPESRPYLDRLGETLSLPQAEGKRIVIVGHTDASGPAGYNLALSKRRAIAVRDYLEARFGIPPSRLEVEGKGKDEPLQGLDPYAPENRRVEFRAAG